MTAEEYWSKLNSIGWLKYLPESTHSEVFETIKKNLATTINSCPHVALVRAVFEYDELPKDILNNLASASNNIFEPIDVTVEKGTLSFTHKKKRYSIDIQEVESWVGEAVIKTANQALADARCAPRFILLSDTPDLAGVVFVPPAIFEKAKKAKLVPNLFYVSFCALNSNEAEKLAKLNKIPKRYNPLNLYAMNIEMLSYWINQVSGEQFGSLRPMEIESVPGRSIFELPSAVVSAIANMPDEKIREITKLYYDKFESDESDIFLLMFSDSMYCISGQAKIALEKRMTVLTVLQAT